MAELEEQDNVTAAAERGISEIHWLLSEMDMNSNGKMKDTTTVSFWKHDSLLCLGQSGYLECCNWALNWGWWGFSLLIKSSLSYLSVKIAIPQSIAQLGAVRSALERKLKPSAAGQSFHADSEGRKLSLSSERQWKIVWDASCGSRDDHKCLGKAAFHRF